MLRGRVLAIMVVLLYAAEVFGQGGGAATGPLPATSADDLWYDIHVLRTVSRLGLGPKRLLPAAQAIQRVAQASADLRKANTDPLLLKLLSQMRAKLLAGQPLTEKDWEQIEKARPDYEALERKMQEAAAQAAEAIMRLLTPQQVAHLGRPEAAEVAEELVGQLRAARALPPDQWQEWTQQQLKELGQRFGGAQAGQLAEDLKQWLTRVRKMDTDQFYAQQRPLVDELAALLQGGEAETPEQVRARARRRLIDLLSHPRSGSLLLAWIQGPGKQGAAAQ